MTIRTIVTFAASIGLTVATATSAWAGPVCLSDGIAQYYFSKLKLPKKPGQATAIVGTRTGVINHVVTGGASARTNGTIVISLWVQAPSISGSEFTLSWIAAAADTLGATAYVDDDGDFQRDDGTLTISMIDCDTVTLP